MDNHEVLGCFGILGSGLFRPGKCCEEVRDVSRNTNITATCPPFCASSTVQAQFTDILRRYNEDFNNYHNEIDTFLRFERMNTSGLMEQQNRMALTTIWDRVLQFKQISEQANDRLIQISQDIGIEGNQNPCIIEMDMYLREADVDAGNNISTCATDFHRRQELAIVEGFFATVDATQRQSHFLQIITLFTLGRFNPITEQAAIRTELSDTWADRANIKAEDRIVSEQFEVQNALQTARINLDNCLAVIQGRLTERTDYVLYMAELCRAK